MNKWTDISTYGKIGGRVKLGQNTEQRKKRGRTMNYSNSKGFNLSHWILDKLIG